MKILILKFRNIGDVLLVEPLISNLKRNNASIEIDVAVNKGSEDMLTLNHNIHNMVAYDRSSIKSFFLIRRIFSEINFYLSFRWRKYDVVVNLTEGDRGSYISWFSGAKIRIGYKNKDWLSGKAYTHYLPKQMFRHTLETNLDPLRALNIPIVNKKVHIFWSDSDKDIVNKKLNNTKIFIHIHPVSRWLFKCIADKIMAKIIDFCEMELNAKVVLTAAPEKAELNKVYNIVKLCKSNPINLSGELSLKQTAALNKKAKLFIGVDTAIMHISAANDTPVLAFFGPSGANHWGPWDNNMTQSSYTQNNGFQIMGKHRVFSESRKCQPCGKDGCNGTKVSDCLMNLDVDIIKENIQEMMGEKNS